MIKFFLIFIVLLSCNKSNNSAATPTIWTTYQGECQLFGSSEAETKTFTLSQNAAGGATIRGSLAGGIASFSIEPIYIGTIRNDYLQVSNALSTSSGEIVELSATPERLILTHDGPNGSSVSCFDIKPI